MSENKHTPGQWFAKPINKKDWVVMSANIVIAKFALNDLPEWNEANALLVAAAPKLLEACKAMDIYFGGMSDDSSLDEPARDAVMRNRAAIVEAEKGSG